MPAAFHGNYGLFRLPARSGDGVKDGVGKGGDLFGPVDEEFDGITDSDDSSDDGATGVVTAARVFKWLKTTVPDPFNDRGKEAVFQVANELMAIS